MKRSPLRSVAASALFIGAVAMPVAGYLGSAMAQSNDSTTTQTTQKPKTDSSAQSPANSGPVSGSMQSGGASSDNGGAVMKPETGSNGGSTKAPADGSASASSNEQKIFTEQKESEVLASTYIGQSVYNANDKSIGEISDLVFDKNGGIKAAIIGVGGFLGIGQKDVAVAFGHIKIQRRPKSADVKLVTDISADQLKKAPAFKNLQAKMDEQNAAKPAAGGTSMGTTGATR